MLIRVHSWLSLSFSSFRCSAPLVHPRLSEFIRGSLFLSLLSIRVYLSSFVALSSLSFFLSLFLSIRVYPSSSVALSSLSFSLPCPSVVIRVHPWLSLLFLSLLLSCLSVVIRVHLWLSLSLLSIRVNPAGIFGDLRAYLYRNQMQRLV